MVLFIVGATGAALGILAASLSKKSKLQVLPLIAIPVIACLILISIGMGIDEKYVTFERKFEQGVLFLFKYCGLGVVAYVSSAYWEINRTKNQKKDKSDETNV
jgi:hypothetical protein